MTNDEFRYIARCCLISISTQNFFWTEKLITIQPGIKADIHKFIREYNNRFTEGEIVSSSKTKGQVANWIDGISASEIVNVQTTPSSLTVTLKNSIKPVKYIIDNKEPSNVSYSYSPNDQGQGVCKITINNLTFYTVSRLLDSVTLQKLWDKVDDYIFDNNVRVAENGNYDTFPNHKRAISDIIMNTPTTIDKFKLGYFINSWQSDIWRDDKSLKINFVDNSVFENKIIDSWSKMGIDTTLEVDESILSVSGSSKSLQLNFLSFQNPINFFTWTNYGGANTAITGFTSRASGESCVIFPMEINGLWPNLLKGGNDHFKRIYLPDNHRLKLVTAQTDQPLTMASAFREKPTPIDYIRFGRAKLSNGTRKQQMIWDLSFFKSKIREIKWYNGWIGHSIYAEAFSMVTFVGNSHLKLPESIECLGRQTFYELRGIDTFTAWNRYIEWDVFRISNIKEFNFMYTGDNIYFDRNAFVQAGNNAKFNFKSKKFYDIVKGYYQGWNINYDPYLNP